VREVFGEEHFFRASRRGEGGLARVRTRAKRRWGAAASRADLSPARYMVPRLLFIADDSPAHSPPATCFASAGSSDVSLASSLPPRDSASAFDSSPEHTLRSSAGPSLPDSPVRKSRCPRSPAWGVSYSLIPLRPLLEQAARRRWPPGTQTELRSTDPHTQPP
jgi:hypothetical protein